MKTIRFPVQAKWLKTLRMTSMSEMSRLCGIPRSTLTMLFNGERRITNEQAQRLAKLPTFNGINILNIEEIREERALK